MIARCCIHCPGCRAKVVVRLSVGYDKRQPFFLPCKGCNAIVRGELIAENPAYVRVEFEDGRIEAESEEGALQSITICPDFPAVVSAGEMWTIGGSPFMLLSAILGDQIGNHQDRLHRFRAMVDRDWPQVRRVTGWYLDENWSQMFSGLQHTPSRDHVEPTA